MEFSLAFHVLAAHYSLVVTLDTKAQFRKLYRQYEAEDRQAKSKPLSAAEITDAADLLRKHFGGQ